MPKPDPIRKASLGTLLCIVQTGLQWLDDKGKLADAHVKVTAYTYDEAEAEIERRFEALNRKIKRLEGG